MLNVNQSILLVKDKDGIYLYDPNNYSETVVYKAKKEQVFLNEPMLLKNDTLYFGVLGKIKIKKDDSLYLGEIFSNRFYCKDVRNNELWLSKAEVFETFRKPKRLLKKQIISYSPIGDSLVVLDTIVPYNRRSRSYKEIIIGKNEDFKERYYSEHSLGSSKVFSSRGSIYYIENADTTILVKYNGIFDSKWGSGYYQPKICPNNKGVLYRYLPNFAEYLVKGDSVNQSLQIVDLDTKEIEVIKTGIFRDPSFSSDGHFVLFKRNGKKTGNNTWISSIYILDMKTKVEYMVGDAYSAFWIN